MEIPAIWDLSMDIEIAGIFGFRIISDLDALTSSLTNQRLAGSN
jgi:hypothetical protein